MLRRKRHDPLAAYAAARSEDRQMLQALLAHGADLAEPRHVLHYVLGCADEAAARAVAAEVPDWQSTVKSPPEGYDDWSVTFERHGYILTPEHVVTDATRFGEVAAARGARYDGWEASV
jgi:hypothetical protein